MHSNTEPRLLNSFPHHAASIATAISNDSSTRATSRLTRFEDLHVWWNALLRQVNTFCENFMFSFVLQLLFPFTTRTLTSSCETTKFQSFLGCEGQSYPQVRSKENDFSTLRGAIPFPCFRFKINLENKWPHSFGFKCEWLSILGYISNQIGTNKQPGDLHISWTLCRVLCDDRMLLMSESH